MLKMDRKDEQAYTLQYIALGPLLRSLDGFLALS